MHEIGRSRIWRAAIALAVLTFALLAISGVAGGTKASGATGKSSALAPGVANAKKDLAKLTAGITQWHGPKTGPKLSKGLNVVFITHQLSSTSEAQIWEATQKVAKQVGWKIKVIDGQNKLSEMQAMIGQAEALKPDAIIAGAIPNSLYPQLAKVAKKIPVICHATAPTPGKWPQLGCDLNVFQDYTKIGQALADWAIIHSNGKLRGIAMTDSTYTIVTKKFQGITNQFKKMGCTGCEVVLKIETPFSNAAQRLPTLVPAWVQKYGLPLWFLSPTDYFSDYIGPALKTLGVSPKDGPLTGMDGNRPNIDRIRSGQNQVMDVAIPFDYMGYQLVDNVNRAVNHAPFSNPATPIWVVDKSNINKYGLNHDELIAGGDYQRRFKSLWATGKTT